MSEGTEEVVAAVAISEADIPPIEEIVIEEIEVDSLAKETLRDGDLLN